MREFLLQQTPYDDGDYDYDFDADSASVDLEDEDEDEDENEDGIDGSESLRHGGDTRAPHVELMPDGQRVETFPCGGFLTKDVLGRVTAVRSARGETVWLRYSAAGKLESFVRTDSRGKTHSRGEMDRHGVVVRDPEGRARASGVSMTVDPLGCFYLHTQDGQFFAVDLISGFHVERRMAPMNFCRDKYITAFFSKDGFRMATKVACQVTESGGTGQHCGFRFYGRDGTMLEFSSYEHVKGRRPAKVLPPGSFPIHKTWRRQRQGNSAWHSLHQYLNRVCS
jgi:YD repeat-containing protein